MAAIETTRPSFGRKNTDSQTRPAETGPLASSAFFDIELPSVLPLPSVEADFKSPLSISDAAARRPRFSQKNA